MKETHFECLGDDGVLEPLCQFGRTNAVINDGFNVIRDQNFAQIKHLKH